MEGGAGNFGANPMNHGGGGNWAAPKAMSGGNAPPPFLGKLTKFLNVLLNCQLLLTFRKGKNMLFEPGKANRGGPPMGGGFRGGPGGFRGGPPRGGFGPPRGGFGPPMGFRGGFGGPPRGFGGPGFRGRGRGRGKPAPTNVGK